MPYSEFLNWVAFYTLEREAGEEARGERSPAGIAETPEEQVAFLEFFQARKETYGRHSGH